MVDEAAPGAGVTGGTVRTGVTRPAARVAAYAVYAVLLATWVRYVGVPSDTIGVFAWLWLAVVAWNVEAPPRSHLDFLRDWWTPLLGLTVYFFSRGVLDELGIPVAYRMPIEVDRWLFGGHLPTQVLQERLCGTPCDPASDPRWFDVLFTTVYTSHFLVGLTTAAVLWVVNRREWAMWMRRFVAINMGALVVYLVYPMAPPWLAADRGYLPDTVERLTARGWSDLGLGRVHVVLQGVGNPVAAMPSLHTGMACLVAFYAVRRWRTPARWLMLLYPATMSFALVYYGEHYVIDAVAGAALAGLVMVGVAAWERRYRPGVWPVTPSPACEDSPAVPPSSPEPAAGSVSASPSVSSRRAPGSS